MSFDFTTYPKSGNPHIDALINFSNYAPPRNSTPGSSVTIYYNLGDSAAGLQALTGDQQAIIRTILADFEAIAGIDFIEGKNPLTGEYDLGFFIGNDGTGGSYWPNKIFSQNDGSGIAGYVEVHQNHLNEFTFLMRHETGHALGLDHPVNYTGHESAPHLNPDDISNFSIMGYNDDTSQTLTEADIATLQYLYGAPLSSTNGILNLSEGNDTHTITSENPFIYGLGGNDFITGTDANNQVQGNAGVDTIYGQGGNDLLRGGKDNDYLQGNAGSDNVYGDRGDDTVRGGKDNDTVRGGKDHDLVYGDRGNDLIRGDIGYDSLRGGKDDDTLYGGDGNDTLAGDKGNDQLYGEAGADIFSFNLEHGVDQIFDFNTAEDNIRLVNVGFFTFESLQPLMSEITEDNVTSTLINLGNLDMNSDIPTGNGFMIIGVSNADLLSTHFLFE